MKNKLIKFIQNLAHKFEPSHPILIPLAFAVIGLIVLNGYKTYQFYKEDPRYCELCHVTKEAKKEWGNSAHQNTLCQDCHSMNVISGNKLILSYVLSNKKSSTQQEHGRLIPWKKCSSCHLEKTSQGSVTMRKSHGHARHVFMEKIGCKKCHTGNNHSFSHDEKLCLKCHDFNNLESFN